MTVEIYALTDPDSGEIRYIGKANDAAKRLKTHIRDARRRNTPVYCWIRKLVAEGKTPGMTVLETVSASDWQAAERRLIAEHRKSGRLLNLAEGGNMPLCSPEKSAATGSKSQDRKSGARVITSIKSQFGKHIRTLIDCSPSDTDKHLDRQSRFYMKIDSIAARLGTRQAAELLASIFPRLTANL